MHLHPRLLFFTSIYHAIFQTRPNQLQNGERK